MNDAPAVEFKMGGFELKTGYRPHFSPELVKVAQWPVVPIEGESDGRRLPITIDAAYLVESAERYAHCRAALDSGFPVLVGSGAKVIDEPCVLVGSGPSAIQLLPEIRTIYKNGGEIIALKGAHDWLLKHGIVPRAAIAMDAQRSRAKCFKLRHRKVLYLCASQMHPDAWEWLRGYRVLVWHSRIGEDQEKRKGWEHSYLVPSASTTGNSAIILLYLLGRRVFELYGFDSSVPDAPTSLFDRVVERVRGRLLKLDGARTSRKKVIQVFVGEERFATTTELVAQAIEIQPMLQQLIDVKVNAHGRGYYQAILAQGKKLGWPV